eukprot:UN05641
MIEMLLRKHHLAADIIVRNITNDLFDKGTLNGVPLHILLVKDWTACWQISKFNPYSAAHAPNAESSSNAEQASGQRDS